MTCELCATPTGDDAAVCTPCADGLAALLGRTPGLQHDLETTLSRQGAAPLRDGGRSAETPLPYDPAAAEAASVLRNTLSTWVRVLIGDVGGAPPRDTVASMARWLARLARWLRHAPYGAEATDELGAAVRQGLRAVDRGGEREYVGRCDCGWQVYARPGVPVVTCHGCGAERAPAEQREWMRRRAEDALLCAADVARAVSRPGHEVTPAMVRGWRRHGRLGVRGDDGRGRPLYRLGDVLDLLAEV